MSWSLFKTKCNVLTGNPHVTPELFAFTIADAYITCMNLHFDSMTGAGVLTTITPQLPLLQQQILMYCNLNRQSATDVDFLAQIGPAFVNAHIGGIILGPLGTVTITVPGQWQNIKVPPNTNFQIILDALVVSCRTHLMTLQGIYVSSVVPPTTSPWSGALLQCLP